MSEDELAMDVENAQDSNSSASSDNDNHEKNLLNKVRQLENDLADNKYLYDSHLELLNLFKQLGDLGSLREAYERFHEYFPLTPDLWLDWIKTEISLASTTKQQQAVFKLFDKATEDYLSVDLWIEYAQFSIGASDLNTTRSILERALTAAGLVCNKGSLIWDTLRELENAHLSLHEYFSEAWKNQVLRIADVFKRQLSVPLLGMENTYSEWQDWFTKLPQGLIDPQAVDYGYKKALKILEIYKPFEESILACNSNEELFKIFKDYIKVVTDPSTIICLYERAAVHLCLIPDFWAEYCNYSFKLGDQALSVAKKALRNCPWSENLWLFKMRVLENLKKEDGLVMDCFEQGISSISPSPGLELWLGYIEYTHRSVGSPEKLDKLFDQAIKQLGFNHDPLCKVSRLFSRILAHRGDMKAARKIWSNILSKPENKGSYMCWLEYATLERRYGEPQTIRALFQKALKAVTDWPYYIIDEWLMYERHFGTLNDVMKCVQACGEINLTLNQNYLPIEQKTQENQNWSSGRPKDVQYEQGRKRRYDRESENRADRKRPREERIDRSEEKRKPVTKSKLPVEKNPETTVFVSNLHTSIDEDKLKAMFPNAVNLEIALDRKGKSRCFGYVQLKTQEEVMVALARDREPLDGRPVFISEIKTEKNERKPVFKYTTTLEKNKLFVRGLPINKSREEIEKIFEKYGANDVRLVLHKSGQPKGLAYVEFESEEQAQKALKETDQMKIAEHVISVAISAPPPKKDRQTTFFDKKDEEPIRHARSRLQTSLLPRSLMVKSEEKKEENTNGSGSKMRSNSDFRNMLLKK